MFHSPAKNPKGCAVCHPSFSDEETSPESQGWRAPGPAFSMAWRTPGTSLRPVTKTFLGLHPEIMEGLIEMVGGQPGGTRVNSQHWLGRKSTSGQRNCPTKANHMGLVCWKNRTNGHQGWREVWGWGTGARPCNCDELGIYLRFRGSGWRVYFLIVIKYL